MKTYRGPEGDERLWFEPDEIERIMEDELRRAGLAPSLDACVVDIERFIERHLHASLDQFADLERDVLGLTEFRPGRPPEVRINISLTEVADSDWCPPGIQGRWRATLAHEAAHVVLHRSLFDLDPAQTRLFNATAGDEPQDVLLRCLKRDVSYSVGAGDTTRFRASDWREVQANRGMAALLMPKNIFVRAARKENIGSTTVSIDLATRRLAERFGVSREATTIRLRTFHLISDSDVIAALF